jgi:hypothetical protein
MSSLHDRLVARLTTAVSLAQLAGAIEAVMKLHKPKRDPAMSLVQHTYCACGATEVYPAPEDGYPSVRPARYPCPDIRAIADALDVDSSPQAGDPVERPDSSWESGRLGVEVGL